DDDGQIGLVGDEQVEAFLGIGFDDVRRVARITLHDVRREIRQQRRGSGREAAQPQGTRALPFDCGDFAADLFPSRVELVGVRQQHPRRGRQSYAAAVLLEQVYIEVTREAAELMRDRRWRI